MTGMEGKVVIVTGGGQGIGKGVALRLLREGARVVIAEADEEAGREAEKEYRSLGEIHFVQTDTADEASVMRMAEETVRRFGRIDGLVNNAAVSEPVNAPIEALSLKEWNDRLAINLTGYFLCVKHTARALREAHGAIVNVSSIRSMQSEPNTEIYATAKGGIDALTHALAISLGPEVRVNAVLPGWIVVDDWKKASERKAPKLRQKDHAQHPVGRAGRPEDIAALVAFLLSEQAAFITGQRFVADGGMVVKMSYEE